MPEEGGAEEGETVTSSRDPGRTPVSRIGGWRRPGRVLNCLADLLTDPAIHELFKLL